MKRSSLRFLIKFFAFLFGWLSRLRLLSLFLFVPACLPLLFSGLPVVLLFFRFFLFPAGILLPLVIVIRLLPGGILILVLLILILIRTLRVSLALLLFLILFVLPAVVVLILILLLLLFFQIFKIKFRVFMAGNDFEDFLIFLIASSTLPLLAKAFP